MQVRWVAALLSAALRFRGTFLIRRPLLNLQKSPPKFSCAETLGSCAVRLDRCAEIGSTALTGDTAAQSYFLAGPDTQGTKEGNKGLPAAL